MDIKPAELFPGSYRTYSKEIHGSVYPVGTTPSDIISNKVQPIDRIAETVEIELREPKGEILFQDGNLSLIAPKFTDLPVDGAYHLQVVDGTAETEKLGQVPILSQRSDARSLVRSEALAVLTEKTMFENDETGAVWMNNNWHTRPPVLPLQAPHEAQYSSQVVDIHAWKLTDPRNVFKPPSIHGMEGVLTDLTSTAESVTDVDIAKYKSDPMSRLNDENIPNMRKPQDFEDWRSHPWGLRDLSGRNQYKREELEFLKSIYGSDDFAQQWKNFKDIEIFRDENPPNGNFSETKDEVLWRYDGFRLVTQKTPLMDAREGIYLQLQVDPKMNVPWQNPTKTLEGYAIAIGLSRLLRDSTGAGEIGDVYIDINNNWGNPMLDKQVAMAKGVKGLNEGETIDHVKESFLHDASMKWHIQLEKIDAQWDIIPAPGLTGQHKDLSSGIISRIKEVIGDGENGVLKNWLYTNCRGKIFAG